MQPVVKPVVNPFGIDNRLYRVCKHSTGCQTRLTTDFTNGCIVYTAGCQTGLYNRFDNRVERTATVRSTRLSNRVCQTGLYNRFDNRVERTATPCLSNRLYNRFDNRLNEQCCSSVSCIQTFNRLSNRFGCLSTRYSRL